VLADPGVDLARQLGGEEGMVEDHVLEAGREVDLGVSAAGK
jgi:hypothetical protein